MGKSDEKMSDMEIEFERKVYKEMLWWKQNKAPDYALFLKGARRVGKSTLARRLGKNEYRSYIEIRFDKAPNEIKDLFINSLEDLDEFFNKIQVFYNTRLYKNESLIILDEIQLFPQARQAVKTLLEDKRYHYVETGSLASIKKKSKDILIPSEEYQLDVLPMDFEEFLMAMGDDITYEVLKKHFENRKPLGNLHRKIMYSFREYMLVGGMPQAVLSYFKTKDFGEVDFVKQSILNLYESDIDVQKEENPIYVKNIFWHIPAELSKHDKRYNLSHVDPNARMREYKDPMAWLDEAMIINVVENVNDPSVAFNLSTIDPSFKCYMMDTGLLISLAYKNKDYLENELYKAILFDKLHINEGMIVENVIAQALRTKDQKVYFFKKTNKELKTTIIEIDFLIRRDTKVIPVEVKSSESNSIKSIKKFKEMYNCKIGQGYVLHEGDIKIENDLIYLPYYMAFLI